MSSYKQKAVFIDGIILKIARPDSQDRNRQRAYNRHKRKSALKFPKSTTLDALCNHLFRLFVEMRLDTFS